MAIIHIDSLAPGMVLQGSICDRNGRMLLPAGVELTDNHLSIMRTWNVLDADVITVDNSDGDILSLPQQEELDLQLLAAAEAKIAPLFVHNDLTHPAMEELFRLCTVREVENVR